MRRLEGKVAMIAGGAGGIGTATCLRLASEGAKVYCADIDMSGVADVVKQIKANGGEAAGGPLDLGDEASIRAAFADARKHLGAIDLLHCNGAMVGKPMEDDVDALNISIEMWNRTLNVDLTGYLICTKEALPDMIGKQKGSIVYTVSGAIYHPEDVRVAYSVAKAGVTSLMRHVAHKWGKQGIRSNAIAPGLILTPATRMHLSQEMRDQVLTTTRSTRLGEPKDIAAFVAMLFSDDGEWVTGKIYVVDGGQIILP